MRQARIRGAPVSLVALVLLAARASQADVPARPLVAALAGAGIDAPLRSSEASGAPARIGVLLESKTPIAGAVRVQDGVYFVRRSRTELEEFLALNAGAPAYYRPPLRPLLDHADEWVQASLGRAEAGLAGDGVYVGVVDTGFDVRHPDLRNADGS